MSRTRADDCGKNRANQLKRFSSAVVRLIRLIRYHPKFLSVGLPERLSPKKSSAN
jgi:hypothetical protein